ncbi:MAG: replication/maintenance protein RepL [Clostridium sp.]
MTTNVLRLLKNETNTKKRISISTEEHIDAATGEILNTKTTSSFVTNSEPDYVKVYLNTMCAFNGLSTSISPVLFEFCKHMSWANDKQVLRVDKFIKEEVARAVNLSVDRINQILREICKSGIFIKEINYRGVYRVNPYFIARGDWSTIKDLRGDFNFTNGKFTINVTEEE